MTTPDRSDSNTQNDSRPIFLQKRFVPMWTAFSLGAFADNMLRQALIIGISFGTISIAGFSSSDDAIPIIGSLFAVSMLVFSSVAGQFADKYETNFLASRAKLIELFIMAIAAFGFFFNNGLLLVFCLFAMGAQSAFFSPVRIGSMPKYYDTSELIRANALFNAGLFVAIILGLFLGGMLIEQPGGGKKVSAFLLVASLLGWIFIRKTPRAKANDPDLKIDWNIARQSIRIVSYAFNAPGIARPVIGLGLFYFISTFVTVSVPLYARDSLGADGNVATAIMGFFAIGAGLGAIAASLMAKNRTGLRFSTFGIIGAGAATVGVFLLTGLANKAGTGTVEALLGSPAGLLLVAMFGMSSACMGLFIVPLQAAIQRRAPVEIRARIMAASNMVNAAAAFLGSNAVLAVTRTSLSPTNGLLLVSLMQFCIALYMVYRQRTVPKGLFDEKLAALKFGRR